MIPQTLYYSAVDVCFFFPQILSLCFSLWHDDVLLENRSKDWPPFPGKAPHTRIQIISAYLVQACLHVTLFSLEVQRLCSVFHCSHFFQSELWQKKNQLFVSFLFSTSGQMLETFVPQNCLDSAFSLISGPLPTAKRDNVGGLEAGWWSNGKDMEHVVVAAALPTELQHFNIFSFTLFFFWQQVVGQNNSSSA